MIWLSAPRAPAAGLNSASSSVEYGVPEYSRVVSGVGDGVALTEEEDDGMETPPFSMEVASVEVADADDPGAAHVEVMYNGSTWFLSREKRVLTFPASKQRW